MPTEIVVPPVFVLLPVRVNVPVPCLIRLPAPLSTPLYAVVLPFPPALSVIGQLPSTRLMLPLPASAPTLNCVIALLLLLKSKLLFVATLTVLFCTALALFNEIAPAKIVVTPL